MEKNTYAQMEKDDFRFTKTLLAIEEKLTDEDIEDGLSPELFNIDVAISGHADTQRKTRNKRDDSDSEVTREDIYDMLYRFGDRILSIKNGGEFSVIDPLLGIGVVCVLRQKYPTSLIIVKTVLNNKNIYVTRGTETTDLVTGEMTRGYN